MERKKDDEEVEETKEHEIWYVRRPRQWHRTKSEWTMAFADGIIIEMVDDAIHDPHIIGSYRWSPAKK